VSGIVGILNRDRAPVNVELLTRMTASMDMQGPDLREVWGRGEAGLGHTLLRTTRESEAERQPCTIDGSVWIAADARVDARAELAESLESAGCHGVSGATDPELILHAYRTWGVDCLGRLIGDFAFLIWDSRARRMFGARDHLGVKPLYYAETDKSFICANAVDTLRLAPGVSSELNPQAVADYLIFDCCWDQTATYFAGIHRLPAGHYFLYTEQGFHTARYWSLQVKPVRYKRAYDYVDHFRELFQAAVNDRLRTTKVTVFMSGGLDSTIVAAHANRAMGTGLRAHTLVIDRLFADEERKYSQLAADFLSIPIEHLATDDILPYSHHLDWQFSKWTPETHPRAGVAYARDAAVSRYSRVALTGSGGDPDLHTNPGYIAGYLRPRRWWQLINGVAWYIRIGRRLPRLGIRSLLRKSLRGPQPFRPPYPAWLNPDLEKRLDLRERYEQIFVVKPLSEDGRSEAIESFSDPSWQSFFESLHPGITGFPLEQRHPFFDLRLVTFLTAIPPLPWCQEKLLFKAAGRGMLPREVLLRPKQPLIRDPIVEQLRPCGPEWWTGHFQPDPELARFVKLDAVSRNPGSASWELWKNLRLISLNYWLQAGRRPPAAAA
jgi:asparagine synthase (glutamine-hydrolysing)